MHKSLDLIVFGATGFTGRLVAEYLNASYGVGGAVAWAIAGRKRDKLVEVRDLVGAAAALPLLIADASDAASLAGLVAQAKVIITAVGPYQRHGQPLVTACAQSGTDYVDLCGEPAWMAQMIPLLDAPARASGARVVFSCGFDSIPFDLGVVFLQDEALRRFGAPLTRVRGRVRVLKGTDFVYDERMLTGDGAKGEQRAKALARSARIQSALLGFAPTRAVMRRFVLPKPGEGPGPHERETGRYEVLFIGETANGQTLRATVKGDRDPGYGSTSKMIAESALCLVNDADRSTTAGGVWTAGAAMGMALVRRLEMRAGLSFSIENQ